ncbi:c-type cytochrome [Desulfocurvibacter africanus]|uniref:c-type cytochrome n=1 Tax=Desulfocurvibacter africanus TaxID=873 RepID=UPI0003FFD7D6|nr:cytochrome c [Desulfocurvibacter africanus]
MNRRFVSIIAALVMIVTVSAVALAEGGNARKGKYLYRKNCRTCHGTTASDLSPMSKTQAEWTKVFAKPETIPCNKEWKATVNGQDLTDINSYLYDYAKDSPTPAKCS